MLAIVVYVLALVWHADQTAGYYAQQGEIWVDEEPAHRSLAAIPEAAQTMKVANVEWCPREKEAM